MSEAMDKVDFAAEQGSEARRKNPTAARHARVAIICASVSAGMLGMSYAAVPLYQLFCQVTGFGGTTQRAAGPSTQTIERTVTMRFDGNTSPKLEWDFHPVTQPLEVKLGENHVAHYRATNTSNRTLWGTATFNVTPDSAGIYFNKIECFCFTEQKLEPGETVDMPVSFFIDPTIVDDKDAGHISQITLSYTFFPLDKKNADERAENDEQAAQPAPRTTKDAG